MMRAATAAALVAAAVAGFSAATAVAEPARKEVRVGEHRMTGGYYGYGRRHASRPYGKAYRPYGRPQVRGYLVRRGGYSYDLGDTTNTYGDSRNVYGANQMFRHWSLDRQTTSGPFDHGFFFDSGIAPRGGDSPYLR